MRYALRLLAVSVVMVGFLVCPVSATEPDTPGTDVPMEAPVLAPSDVGDAAILEPTSPLLDPSDDVDSGFLLPSDSLDSALSTEPAVDLTEVTALLTSINTTLNSINTYLSYLFCFGVLYCLVTLGKLIYSYLRIFF